MWKPKVICAYIGIIFFAFCLSVGIGEAVTAATENAPISRGTVYILDAGHGGEDGGAISCTGAKESDINLQITLRLNDVFHLLGRETRLIRETDVSVYTSGNTIAAKKVSDLKHRVSIVNETADAVLVSIHQNTFPESKYYGPQVFYNGKGSSETLAKKLQVSLNASLSPRANGKASRGRVSTSWKRLTHREFWWNVVFCPTKGKRHCFGTGSTRKSCAASLPQEYFPLTPGDNPDIIIQKTKGAWM